MEKTHYKLFLLATIGLIALSYSVDTFAESENETIFSEDTIITDTTMVSGETWTVQSGVTLTIESNVSLVFEMESVLNNEGTIKAKRGSGGLYVDGDSILNNYGLIETTSAFTVRVGSTVNNEGIITTDDNNNQGVVIKGTFNNNAIGVLNNLQAGEFYVDGVFNNDGHMVNKGEFIIQSGGTLNNEGTVNNDGRMINNGVFNYNGSFDGRPILGTPPVKFSSDGGEILIIQPDASLKSQISTGVSPEEIKCFNLDHVLVQRTNVKLACVESATAEKLGWKLI